MYTEIAGRLAKHVHGMSLADGIYTECHWSMGYTRNSLVDGIYMECHWSMGYTLGFMGQTATHRIVYFANYEILRQVCRYLN